MATTVTKTIKSSGGDYTSLSSFEAALPSSLVSNDEVWVAECYNFQDTTGVLWSGATTDATRYVRVYAPNIPGKRERHICKRGTGYRLIVSATTAYAMDVRIDHIRFEGLEIKCSVSGGSAIEGLNTLSGSSDVRVEKCLIYDSNTDGLRLGCGNWKIGNNIVVGNGRYNITCDYKGSGTDGVQRWHNNIFAGSVDCGRIFNSTGQSIYGYNNFYHGTSSDFVGTFTAQSNQASPGGGFAYTVAYSTSSGAYFVNVTAGSEYLQIKDSSGLTDVGADLSADANYPITDDIWGNTRSGTFDIGAIDTGQPAVITRTIKSSGGHYSSASAWQVDFGAGLAATGSLITERTILEAECYAFQDTTDTLYIDDVICSATYYVRFYAYEWHQWQRSTGYRMYRSGATACIDLNGTAGDQHWKIERIAMRTGGGYETVSLDSSTTSGTNDVIEFDSCVVWDTGGVGWWLGDCKYKLRNCAAMNIGTGSRGFFPNYSSTGTGVGYIYNCVAFNCQGAGFDQANDPVDLINCYSGGNGGNDYGGTWNSKLKCASEDTTGTSGYQSIAFSTSSGAYFTNVTAGSEDPHISSASSLYNVGNNLSADSNQPFNTDGDGDTRLAWSIGIDDGPAPHIMQGAMFQRIQSGKMQFGGRAI